MNLVTERLILRPRTPEDAESLYKYASDDRVGPIAGWHTYKSVKESRQIMLNVLPFCLGMLATYYAVAAWSHGVYSKVFIIGWTVFALCSPVMAYFTWLTKEKGIFPKIIGVGIVAVSVLSSILLFDRLRVYDFIIDGVLIYVLFIKKIDRTRSVRSKKDEK